jgi:hypothetical protein
MNKIGLAKYITKFDLLKGFYQVPLTDRAKEISAFVAADGLYQYKVTPFGTKKLAGNLSKAQELVNQ